MDKKSRVLKRRGVQDADDKRGRGRRGSSSLICRLPQSRRKPRSRTRTRMIEETLPSRGRTIVLILPRSHQSKSNQGEGCDQEGCGRASSSITAIEEEDNGEETGGSSSLNRWCVRGSEAHVDGGHKVLRRICARGCCHHRCSRLYCDRLLH